MDITGFRQSVELAFSSGNWDSFEEWITQNCSFAYNYGTSEPALTDIEFDTVLGALADPRLLNSEGSGNLVRYIEYEWGRFTHDQKRVLVAQLAQLYESLVSPLAWFLICEILGEYCADRSALRVTVSLRNSDSDQRRAYTAMAFGKLIRYASDAQVIIGSRRELERMKADHSPLVQEEVRLASLGLK